MTVTPFVPTRDNRWPPPEKPNRLTALVKGFLNPHDAGHLAICASVCTSLHFFLEWIL